MQHWVALFPLQVVLLPEGELPLHIFEDRYKEMIRDVLTAKSEFGVVLASDKGIVNTGCTASISKVLREYPDGRMDILTVGRRRFEIQRINDERSYLRGEVEYFDDEDEDGVNPDHRQQAIEGFDAVRALASDPPLPPFEIANPRLSFLLAQAVTDLVVRQSLLMTRSEADRIQQLATFFPSDLARQKKIHHVKNVAPRNGHGTPPADLK